MNEKYYGKIVGKNLRRLAYEYNKTQADISRDLNISKATISSWMNGTRIPRMKTIDRLCIYFHCSREDIMEEREEAFVSAIPEVIVDVMKSKYGPQLLEYATMLGKLIESERR